MKKGDKVSVLDDDIKGIITAVDNDQVSVLTEDDFEMQYTKKELVIINDIKYLDDLSNLSISKSISEKEPEKVKRSDIKKSKKKTIPPMEVDLHIHQLIPDCRGLESHEKLTIQLETVKNRLEFAFQKKIQRIVFIHGVGEGVLREELQYLLKRYDHLDFYDADFQKYGVGATEVYIYQSKTT